MEHGAFLFVLACGTILIFASVMAAAILMVSWALRRLVVQQQTIPTTTSVSQSAPKLMTVVAKPVEEEKGTACPKCSKKLKTPIRTQISEGNSVLVYKCATCGEVELPITR